MIYFKRIYKDDALLPNFMNRCKDKGLNNNISVSSLKFDYFKHSAFFGGIQNNNLKIFSGVHNFDYDNKQFWRVGFRAVTLYDKDLKPISSKNFRKSSLHLSVNFYFQMKWVETHFGPSNFILTSNDFEKSIDGAGSSHRIDKFFKKGHLLGCSLLYENIDYLNTIQNVWLLDKQLWFNYFEEFCEGKISYDQDIYRL